MFVSILTIFIHAVLIVFTTNQNFISRFSNVPTSKCSVCKNLSKKLVFSTH